ncbi:MAG: FAD binding domain-containing protein [Oscillospiraceae bacterium]|jgi:NADPH-dependent glutamate synthase beta subunit-like oxidoreductase|nr:FAD binding domain-containing protein [Oscillospiraceae bacterium]
MKPFQHISAKTVEEAARALGDARSRVIAGGTDFLAVLKDNILPTYPARLVNIKSIEGLDYITEENGALRIGALTRVADIAGSEVVRQKWAALAQAANCVASPHIRDMGTIGGNISQLPRCWYFRKAENRFNCSRKGGDECFAILGDNRYHSAFGGMRCHASPCMSECPAGTDIPGYFEKLRSGDWDAAADIIMRVNPFPAITGRVCAHFCQNACNRRQTDEGLQIGGVERALGDYILNNYARFYKPPEKETGKTVAIVGSGPAGLAAAFFLRRVGNSVTVFDSKEEAGGMLMYAIPAYRLPRDLVRKSVKALEGTGVIFKQGASAGVDIRPEALESQYDCVCYATGTWKRPVVGIDGEELTVFGLDFLVEVKKWMDGKVGEEVLVTGGGNVAMDVSITAKRLGAKNVTLACLEPRDRMPASDEEIARAEAEGITILPSWGLSKVLEENGEVKGMELKRCVTVWDETGAFDPKYDENEKRVVNVRNILMAVGQRADLSFLDEKYQLQLDRRGLINVSEASQMTSREGVFAAGDATTGPATVIGAVTTGRRAAEGVNQYLEVLADGSLRESPSGFIAPDVEGIKNKTALKLRELDADKRRLDLEDSESPDEREAGSEAGRCLDCGCYAAHQSDLAPALVALSAAIVTNKRTLGAEEFFRVVTYGATALDFDEIITEIRIPPLPEGAGSAFKKFAYRKSIDFPVVNCAIVTGDDPRVCLGAVAPIPLRATKAEDVLRGKSIDNAVAEAAGEAAGDGAHPFEATKYKIQIAKTIVKRTLLEMWGIEAGNPQKRYPL